MELALAVDRLLAHRWYPRDAEPAINLSADEQVLRIALASPSPALRRPAVRALGRFEDPRRLSEILPFLLDMHPTVRIEAAHAIGQAFRHSKDAGVRPAKAAIERALIGRRFPSGGPGGDWVSVLYESYARLAYEDATAAEVEQRLVLEIAGPGPTIAPPTGGRSGSALTALTILIQRNPGRGVAERTLAVLRELAKSGYRKLPSEPSSIALQALVALNYRENDIALNALNFRCPPPAIDPACGGEIRRMGVQILDLREPEAVEEGLKIARKDPSYLPRLEAVRVDGGRVAQTQRCRPLIDALSDTAVHVQFEALAQLSPECLEREEIVTWLKASSIDFGPQPAYPRASLAARSLLKLCALHPDGTDAARKLIDASIGDASWREALPVRTAIAIAAGLLGDEKLAILLFDDREPNVRDEALRSLARLNSQAKVDKALIALESSDLQLVRTGAEALRGARHDSVLPTLFRQLERLTTEGKDTSRDARLEIFERFKEQARPNASGVKPLFYWLIEVEKYLKDFDPEIASVAADTVAMLTGTRPAPKPTRRLPQQPTVEELTRLPSLVRIHFNTPGDSIDLRLLWNEAPITVARFLGLARAGFYDNSHFYRLVPLNVLVGGSPAGNQFAGDARFWRDEIGVLRHTAGMVGMMSHGRDSGNGQFFVNLIDGPQWNYDYTVFAQLSSGQKAFAPDGGVAVITSLLDGARISRIEIPR